MTLARPVLVRLVVLLVLVTTACADSEHGHDQQPNLRVGQLRSNLEPLLEAAGQLDDVPYSIEWSSFDTGPEAIEAENAGAVDISYMADTPPIFAQAAGVDVHIVGLTKAIQGAQNVALVVSTDSDLQEPADLKGRTVAVVPGTVTQYLLIRVLDNAGLSLSDVKQFPLQGPEAITALRDGDVDAIALVDPLLATSLAEGDARVLVDGSDLLTGSNAFVASDEALEDQGRESAIGDLLVRVRRALDWSRSHQQEWAQAYADVNHLSLSAATDAVRRAATGLTPLDDRAIQAQQGQVDAFYQAGLLDSRLAAADEFDDRYNRQVFEE
jgi:sulfonate transport system substrate-binding protein